MNEKSMNHEWPSILDAADVRKNGTKSSDDGIFVVCGCCKLTDLFHFSPHLPPDFPSEETDMATVSASDIVPTLYDNDSDSNSDESENHEDQVDDLTYDTYNLVACDYHQIVLDGDAGANEAKIQEAATRATQLLINKYVIFASPHYFHHNQ